MKKIKLEKSEKNLLINILIAFGIKGLSLLISLFSTPLYIKYFDDNTVLGVWYTILSVLTWITIADLGLGNGLRNKLTQDLAQNDKLAAKKHISSAYVVISVIIIPITILGIVLIQVLDLNTLLNISESVISNKTLRLSVTILFSGVCLQFIVKIISNVLYAIQRPSINNVKALITSIIPLLYIACFKSENIESNLIALSVVHVIAVLLPSLVATFVIFGGFLKDCRPSLRLYEKKYANDIIGLGLKFFLAQIFFMMLMSTNEVLITKFYKPEDVVEYSIYYKLFTTVGSLFMLALTPLWSKLTQDISKKRFSVVKKTNRILYGISGLCLLAQFAIIPILQWFLDFWLKENSITVNLHTALIFAFFGGVYVFNVALTTLANGIGELKTQMIFYGIGSIAKIPILMIFRNMGLDWNIIVLYNAIVVVAFCIFQLLWVERKIKNLSSNIKSEEI